MNRTQVKKLVIGVVIKYEETACAVVDVKGNIIAKNSFPTMEYPEIGAFTTALSNSILELVEQNGGYEQIRSVGISTPSGHFMSGSMVNAPNMPWKGVIPLAVMLQDRLSLAVAVGNNAYATALSEHAFGIARGMNDFIVVTLGSGMGSCFFSNGQPHLGFDGFAGEVGHTCIKKDGRTCGCGNKGCLETYTAAKGIVMTAQEVLAESRKPSMMRSVEKLTPMVIAQLCDQGDELAQEVYSRTGKILGLGLANYASLLNPEAIIFSGNIINAGKWLLDPAMASYEENVFHNTRGKVKFVVSEFDSLDHDILGASVLAWEVKEYSLFK